MAKKRPPERDPLLLEVAAAVGAGRIRVAAIEDTAGWVHGLTYPNGEIVIDPSVDTVDTLVHECIHRLRPGWSERAVRSRTGKLMRALSRREMTTLYTLLLVSTQRPRKRIT